MVERGHHSLRRLRIAAVPNTESELDATPTRGTEEPMDIEFFLNLSLLFTKCPSSKEFPAKQIIWRGLFSKEESRHEFSGVAEKVLYKLRCQKSSSKSLNATSTSSKLAEAALENSEQVLCESSGRMEKVIRGQNSVETVVSVAQIPRIDSAVSPIRGGYGLKNGFWTDPRGCMLSLLTVFVIGYLAARPSIVLSAFIEP